MDQLQNIKYTPAIHKYKRRETLEVKIGNTPLGGLNPIRLQSMTNTRTNNIEETVEQCIRIFNAGADYVRITAPTTKDAELLAEIKSNLVKKGYNQPLIADIH